MGSGLTRSTCFGIPLAFDQVLNQVRSVFHEQLPLCIESTYETYATDLFRRNKRIEFRLCQHVLYPDWGISITTEALVLRRRQI